MLITRCRDNLDHMWIEDDSLVMILVSVR